MSIAPSSAPASKVRRLAAEPAVEDVPARHVDALGHVGAIDGFDRAPPGRRVQRAAPLSEPFPPPNLPLPMTVEDITRLPPTPLATDPVPTAALPDDETRALARRIVQELAQIGRAARDDDTITPQEVRDAGNDCALVARIGDAWDWGTYQRLVRGTRDAQLAALTDQFVARARVPTPGRQVLPLFTTGGDSTKLRVVIETTVEERVRWPGCRSRRGGDRVVSLEASRRMGIEAAVPPGHVAVFWSRETDVKTVAVGEGPLWLAPGRYRVALYEDAATGAAADSKDAPPVEVCEVVVPALPADEHVDLSAFAGFELYGDDDVPLQRQLDEGSRVSFEPARGEATWQWSAVPRPLSDEERAIDAALAYPPLRSPPGRYATCAVPGRFYWQARAIGLTVELLRGPVVRVTHAGKTSVLTPSRFGLPPLREPGVPSYDANSNRVEMWLQQDDQTFLFATEGLGDRVA
jgi:hypothetical protein